MRTVRRSIMLAGVAVLLGAGALAGGRGSSPPDAPRVVTLRPDRWDYDVDAHAVVTLEIEFDRSMITGSQSICGGGPEMPKITGSPVWKNARRVVVPVALEPGHDYRLSLNSASFRNFKSAQGVALEPVPWSFGTLPADFRPAPGQKARNQEAFEALQRTIDEKYSHRDLRVQDWKRAYKAAAPAFLAARSDRGWAGVAARLLEPAADLHLHLALGDSAFYPASRAVDSLFRNERLAAYVAVEPAGPNALAGRSADDIGYLMVGAWTKDIDPDAVEAALARLLDCKAMVIDARPNAGGDETLAQRIAAWFVEGTKVYAKDRFRTGPGKTGFGPILERSVSGHADPAKRFKGPIAVLTSRYVMSSNESFVLMLRQAKDCTVVGQPTFGSSGNPRAFDLPNGVSIVLPTWQDLRLDGTCFEGEGLAPDVLVEVAETDLATRDPILEKALEILRAKLPSK